MSGRRGSGVLTCEKNYSSSTSSTSSSSSSIKGIYPISKGGFSEHNGSLILYL